MQYHILTSKDKSRLFKKAKRCSICLGKSKTGRLVTDHCHTSGEIREVLCEKCNSWLGVFESTIATERRKNKVAKRIKRKYDIDRFTFERYLEKYAYLKKPQKANLKAKKKKIKKASGNAGVKQPKYRTLPNDMGKFKPMISVSLE